MKALPTWLAFLVSLTLTACDSPVVPQPQPLTPVSPSALPKPSAEATLDASLPVAGGTLTLGLPLEPLTLNPLQASNPLQGMVSAFMVEGLVGVDVDGNYAPVLAESLPDLSTDGLTLTYPLKQDVRWSNGEALTCADVQFTLAAILAEPAQVSAAGYRDIASLDCPDSQTVVVTFAKPYAPYLRLFPAILPASTGDPAKMGSWAYNRAPIGTGPWVVSEWQAGDSITLARNPYYRETGKPYLENIILRILPTREAGLLSLSRGEITALWGLTELDLPTLQDMPGVTWSRAPSGAGENELLVFNLGATDGSASADPSATPHPILSDLRVRQAIQLAIDKQQLTDSLPPGGVKIGSTALPAGPFACPQPLSQFDPTQARALLEEAGWRPGVDGIRVKEELRLSLRIGAAADDPLRIQIEQALAAMLRSVGVEIVAENLPTERLFASWESDGPRKKGRFDLLMYTSGSDTDPDGYLFSQYHSLRIPSEANNGLGSNFSRYANPAVDQWLDEAALASGMAERHALYCKVVEQINRDLPRLFLYERFTFSAQREGLQNFRISPGAAGFAVLSQDWWLRPRVSDEEASKRASAPTYLIASHAAAPTPTNAEPEPLIPPPASLLPQFGGMLIGLLLMIGAALLVKFRQNRK